MRAPAWVLALISGGVLGLGMALINRFVGGNSWTGAPLGAVFVLMGRFVRDELARVARPGRDRRIALRRHRGRDLHLPAP